MLLRVSCGVRWKAIGRPKDAPQHLSAPTLLSAAGRAGALVRPGGRSGRLAAGRPGRLRL